MIELSPIALETLGWVSGATVTISGFPNYIRNMRYGGPARPSPLRDTLQCLGNIGWMVFGLLSGVIPIAVMCGVNAACMIALLVQQAHRKDPDKAGAISPSEASGP